jgi:NAD(P)-dependent dehydrogenase (short-subunit alcohol dehydrogenase family)
MSMTIVMTGATSGFGAVAAERIARAPDVRLLVGARTPAPGDDSIPLDLDVLESVRAFAAAIEERLGNDTIDAVACNAGIVRAGVETRTVDGYETTFAVNHLAHYLLVRLLMPKLADRAVVVLTTSGTHDPATGAGLLPPRHANADLLAHPDRDPDLDPRPRKAGEHAYSASKLCSVLTVRSLAEQPEARRLRLTVVAYDPGQVFGTGLAEDLSLPLRIAWSVFGSPLGWPLRRLSPTLNTKGAAGNALADLALGLAIPTAGDDYAALRRGRLVWREPSELARQPEAARALWDDSSRLVGLEREAATASEA